MASALSANPSPSIALEEVVNKVLSEPIRPHFAIANVCGGRRSALSMDSLNFLSKKLGPRTPIVMSSVRGIMGIDVMTNQFREMKLDASTSDNNDQEQSFVGIVLTVGFLPGLKVDAIPLLREKKGTKLPMVDNFVMDIRNYSLAVSNSISPIGIVMFSVSFTGLRHTIEKLDYAMSKETIIVGDYNNRFIYKSGTESRNLCNSEEYFSDAVALVFARDRDKPFGEIQFHAALSNGVCAIGPWYKAASVKVNRDDRTIWLNARREGQGEILDGQRIVDQISDELGNYMGLTDLYIGVTRRRKCFVGSEKSRMMTTLSFYGVDNDDEQYLYVEGEDIKSGDCFRFYYSNPGLALSSSYNVYANLINMKLNNVGKMEFLGGFTFSCCARTESFFGYQNVDSSQLLNNFPEIPLAGILCGGEIGRGESIINVNEGYGEELGSILMHVFSCVFVLMSYTPASLAH